MNKKKLIYIGTVIIVLAFISAPLLPYYVDFGTGTDNAATDMIINIKPDVKPWFEYDALFDMDKYEPLLFCLQLSLGLGIFGYCYHLLRKYKNTSK